MMKKILFFGILLLGSSCLNSAAITIYQDTITNNIRSNMDYLYETVIPILDRIEISGNSEASQELRKRWSRVVQHLKNNKELMYSEVKKIMLAPNGRSINIETIKNFIDITEQDSVKKITLNPDFLLDELKKMGEKIKDASVKMVEQK